MSWESTESLTRSLMDVVSLEGISFYLATGGSNQKTSIGCRLPGFHAMTADEAENLIVELNAAIGKVLDIKRMTILNRVANQMRRFA